jgi:hypothetical protein
MYRPPLNHPGKDPFPWHDAVACYLKNGAMVVTFLTDLSYFQNHVPADKDSPHGKAAKVYALHHQILAKGSMLNFDAPGPEVLNFFIREEAYLPVPVPGVSVAFDAVIGRKFAFAYIVFYHAFFRADTNRKNFSHDSSL